MKLRGVVVAALVASLSACSPASPTSAPVSSPTSASAGTAEVGPATDLPWWDAGRLHVGGATHPTARPTRTLVGGGTTVVLVRGQYLTTRGGAPLRALPHGGAIQPYSVVVSPDGRELAWIETVADHTRHLPDGEPIEPSHVDVQLVAYDVVHDRVVGTLPRSTVTACCDAGGAPRLQGILADGRVVYFEYGDVVHPHRYGPVLVWDPTAATTVPVRVRTGGVGLDGVLGWPGGIARTGAGPHLLRVAADGTTTPVAGPGPGLDDAAWNPAGTELAHETGSGRVAVDPLGTGAGVVLPTVRGGFWAIAGWESDTQVVLADGRQPGGAVRCDVRTSVCERVGGLPSHAVRLGLVEH